MNLDNYYQLIIVIDLRSTLLANLGAPSLMGLFGLVPSTSLPLTNKGVISAVFLV